MAELIINLADDIIQAFSDVLDGTNKELDNETINAILDAVSKGKALPKYHGKLIDGDKLLGCVYHDSIDPHHVKTAEIVVPSNLHKTLDDLRKFTDKKMFLLATRPAGKGRTHIEKYIWLPDIKNDEEALEIARPFNMEYYEDRKEITIYNINDDGNRHTDEYNKWKKALKEHTQCFRHDGIDFEDYNIEMLKPKGYIMFLKEDTSVKEDTLWNF